MRDPREVSNPYPEALSAPTGPMPGYTGPTEGYPATEQARQYNPYPPYGDYAPYSQPTVMTTPPTTNTAAILSLIFSILGFFTWITAIPGVILGHIALGQLKRDPNQDGHSMAIIGLVIGYILIAIPVAIAILFVALLVLGVIAASQFN